MNSDAKSQEEEAVAPHGLMFISRRGMVMQLADVFNPQCAFTVCVTLPPGG